MARGISWCAQMPLLARGLLWKVRYLTFVDQALEAANLRKNAPGAKPWVRSGQAGKPKQRKEQFGYWN
jgi:hypothetical protein